jgi:hypothetical protein
VALDESQRLGAGSATNLGHPATERFPQFKLLPAKARRLEKEWWIDVGSGHSTRTTRIKKIYHTSRAAKNEIAYRSLIWDFETYLSNYCSGFEAVKTGFRTVPDPNRSTKSLVFPAPLQPLPGLRNTRALHFESFPRMQFVCNL